MHSPHPGLTKTNQFHFRLLVTMIHGDIFKAVMSVVHGTLTPRTSETRYHLPNRKILQLETTLEPIQQQWEIPLV